MAVENLQQQDFYGLRPVETVKMFIRYRGYGLLLRRAGPEIETNRPGDFDLPGGGMEPGESLQVTAMREGGEELGPQMGLALGRGAMRYIHTSRSAKPEAGIHVVRHFLEVEVDYPMFTLDPTEHSSGAWYPFESLPEIMTHPPHIEAYYHIGDGYELERLAA